MGIIKGIVNGIKELFRGKKEEAPIKEPAIQAPIVPSIVAPKPVPVLAPVPEPVQKKAPPFRKTRRRTKKLRKTSIPKEVAPKEEIIKELKLYRKTVQKLRKQVKELKAKVEAKSIESKEALGGVRVIYGEMKQENRNIDKEEKQTKSLLDYLENDFMQHKVSEQMFREKMFNYNEKLHILAMEKKELASQKKDLSETTKKIPNVMPVSLEQISRTTNLEKLIEKQQKTLEKLASRPTVVIHGATSENISMSKGTEKKAMFPMGHKKEAELVKKTFEKAPDSKKINLFLKEKASGKIDGEKLSEVEGKVSQLMQKYNISEKEVEQKLEKQGLQQGSEGPDNLIESVNKLVNLLELEKKTNSHLQESEKISTAMATTMPMKKTEEITGIATEIKKHRIITDFDKITIAIVKKGRAKIGEISKELGIPRKRVEECSLLLEKEGQIKITYPPIGDAFVETPDYKERVEMEKLRKKEAKGSVK